MKAYEIFEPEIRAIFDYDPRIILVREYNDGFVPRSFRWPAPGKSTMYSRCGLTTTGSYDRKRRYGDGPTYVGYTSKSAIGFTAGKAYEIARKQGHL